jgi:hypothetical protein
VEERTRYADVDERDRVKSETGGSRCPFYGGTAWGKGTGGPARCRVEGGKGKGRRGPGRGVGQCGGAVMATSRGRPNRGGGRGADRWAMAIVPGGGIG